MAKAKKAEKTGEASEKTKSTATKTDIHQEYPEKLILVKDPAHVAFDERVNRPFNENTVRNMLARGVLQPILCRRTPAGFEVQDGRGRVINLIEANRRIVEKDRDGGWDESCGTKPRQIRLMLSQAKDNEILGNLISANHHRTVDPPSLTARNVARYLALGHDEEDTRITFCLSRIVVVRAYCSLAEAHPDVLAALDSKKLSFGTAVKIAREPYDDQALLVEGDQGGVAPADQDDSAHRQTPEGVKAEKQPKVEKKKITARAIEVKRARLNGEEVASAAPSKKVLKKYAALIGDGLASARFIDDAPTFTLRDIGEALRYAFDFAIKGDADQPEAVRDCLLSMAAEKAKSSKKSAEADAAGL